MQAMRIIREIQSGCRDWYGWFCQWAGGVASWLLRRPLIIHEQNAKAGLTNKLLARFAKVVLEGFPATFKPRAKCDYDW